MLKIHERRASVGYSLRYQDVMPLLWDSQILRIQHMRVEWLWWCVTVPWAKLVRIFDGGGWDLRDAGRSNCKWCECATRFWSCGGLLGRVDFSRPKHVWMCRCKVIRLQLARFQARWLQFTWVMTQLGAPALGLKLGGCTVYYVWESCAFMTPPKKPLVYERLYV